MASFAPARIRRYARAFTAQPPAWLRAQRAWLFLIGVAALVTRLPLFFVRGEITPGGDSREYVAAAKALAHLSYPGMFRMPGYPLFIWFCSLLPGRTEDGVLIVQHLIGVALALAITALGWRWLSPAAGVLAGTLEAISPVYVSAEDFILADFLFGAALFAGTASLAAVCASGRYSRGAFILIGALFAAATYIKPVGQALVLAAPIALALTSSDRRRAIRGAAVVAATMIVLLVPWALRNAIAYGEFRLSNQSGVTLYNRAFEVERLPVPNDDPQGPLVRRLNAEAVGNPAARPSSYVRSGLARHGFPSGEVLEIQGRLAVKAIRREPVTYLKTSVKRVRRSILQIHSRVRSPERLRNAPAIARRPATTVLDLGRRLENLWWELTITALASLILLLVPGPRRAAVVALISAPLVVIIVTVLTHGGNYRYSIQAAPELWLLSCAGLVFVVHAAIREVRRERGGRA